MEREVAEQRSIDSSDADPHEKAEKRDEARRRADEELGVGDKPDVAPS